MARVDYFDFRGGLNTRFNVDSLSVNELRLAQNARLDILGAVSKRAGTQRLHGTALDSGADVLGVFQWDNPSQSKELIAIAGGNLYHKALGDANYTEVASTLTTTNLPWFVKFTRNGTDTLYIADGALRKWTGTTLTTSISGTGPGLAKYAAVYKSRLFVAGDSKVIYWSKVADPETWSSPDGGQANVETYDDDVITGLATVGSSLLIFKENNVARYTGTSIADISIDQDTEGVSPDVGCIAPGSIVRVENFVFFLSDRGPYIATEGGVQEIGQKVADFFQGIDSDVLAGAVSVHNRRRQEVLLMIPEAGDSENTIGLLWNYRLQAWTGPQDFGFNVLSASRLEDADGFESIQLGGSDGFTRNGDVEDVGAKDDVVSAGTGGTNIELDIQLPPVLMGDPTAVKTLYQTQHVQADLGAYGELQFVTTCDLVAGENVLRKDSRGAGVKGYLFRPAWKGRRPVLNLREKTDEIVVINGVTIEGKLGRRLV